MGYYTPIIILIISNVAYQVCSKSTPAAINPLAMLALTYLICSILCVVLYYCLHMGEGLAQEYQHFNWSGVLMGLAIVGMEVGTIYMYKVGWKISVGMMFSSTLVAICLVILGVLVYKETITLTKMIGIVICLAGMYLINK